MKYFYDTEFIEGVNNKKFLGLKTKFKTKPTIDLISIGMVDEDGREYYAVSKDFDLNEAWNRYDEKVQYFHGDMRNQFPNGRKYKVYWIRENVLKPIFYKWNTKDIKFHDIDKYFTKKEFKRLLKINGKSNRQIASEIKDFVNPNLGWHITSYNNSELKNPNSEICKHFDKHNVKEFDGYFLSQPEFYNYYGSYDHVVFCWIFGKMIDLPKGFPMYSIDLKQKLEDIIELEMEVTRRGYQEVISDIKNNINYPKNLEEHCALSDAKWNYEFYKFLKNKL